MTRTILGRAIFFAGAAVVMCALSFPARALERPPTVSYTHEANAASAQALCAPKVLEQARIESPLLGDIVEEFASRDLGEGSADESLDDRTREIATVAAYAALGDIEATKRHALYALRYGATNGQLREVLYLTAVQAGAPKAIKAARALAELISE